MAPLSPEPAKQAMSTLVVALDWTPNANHVGFYVAAARPWPCLPGDHRARGRCVLFGAPQQLPQGHGRHDGNDFVAVRFEKLRVGVKNLLYF